MGNRIKAVVLVFIFVFISMSTAIVQAKTVNKALLTEPVKGKAPNVKVYMTGSEMSDGVSVSGSVSDIALMQDRDVKCFEETGEGLRYIILLDNSGSIGKLQFDEAKKQLKKLRKNLKNTDEMLLYTLGTLDIYSDKTDVLGRVVWCNRNGSDK
ncbi:MAG: VWA domain-containing protein [Lachnospiraceae bacterium]|nr:VWA domain-containing protein [Lachnospiraceae bacterium]